MNRGDARLAFVIVSTAILSAGATAAVLHLVAPPSNDAEVAALARRIAELEVLREIDAVQRDVPCPEPRAPAPIAEPTPPDPEPCDEVSCVLNNYEPRCCAHFVPPRADNLDRTMIATGVARIKPKVFACGERTPVHGTVKVSVKVAPSGVVSTVTLVQSPDPTLGQCVVDAMSNAGFGATKNGGRFTYPFVF